MRVLVTGATGYVGGRLIPELIEADHEVHVLARDANKVPDAAWADRVKVHVGDLLRPATLPPAFDAVDRAFYLVHSMGSGADFAKRDRQAATNVVNAAQHLEHVVYLGGLLPDTTQPSEHLASRAEVGRILREGLATTEFRAGPIVGAGSGSFEMVRHLTERLPVMVAPKWILNQVQPIAVDDVIAYLAAAIGEEPAGIVEIGGADQLTFREMMLTYADVRGLRRVILPVPVLTPHLAALWVELVTPIPNSLAIPLIEGIVAPVLADTTRARELFPAIEPLGYRQAVERALVQTRASAAPGTIPAGTQGG